MTLKSGLAASAILLGMVAMTGACGSGSASTPEKTIVVTQTSVVTKEAAAPAKSADASSSKADDEKVDSFTMPKVVGEVLQDAQDKLQSLGSYLMDQKDASGLDRLQILDSNWRVCKQSPKAGTVVPLTATVVLSSVKLDEKCP